MATSLAVAGEAEQAVKPIRDTLMGLTDAFVQMRGSMGGPLAPSRAIDEMAAVHLRDQHWGGVDSAYAAMALTVVAAGDAVRSYARLLGPDEAPLFAHLVLARAALDAAGRAAWLADPAIGPETRLVRYQLLRVAIGKDQKQHPLPEAQASGERVLAEVESGAAARKMRCSVRRRDRPPTIGDEQLVSSKQAISALFTRQKRDDGIELGDALWAYFSAVTHANPSGLMQSVNPGPEVDLLGAAPIETDVVSLALHGSLVAEGFAVAATRVAILNAWPLAGWEPAVSRIDELQGAVLRARGLA